MFIATLTALTSPGCVGDVIHTIRYARERQQEAAQLSAASEALSCPSDKIQFADEGRSEWTARGCGDVAHCDTYRSDWHCVSRHTMAALLHCAERHVSFVDINGWRATGCGNEGTCDVTDGTWRCFVIGTLH